MKAPGSTLAHHEAELSIALDPMHPQHALPDLRPTDRQVLDVGCGMGQSLVALVARTAPPAMTRFFGVDVDAEAIERGQAAHARIEIEVAPAEHLPFDDARFDLVFSRIALPYTNVPRALDEMTRVLKPDGRIWITLQSLAHAKHCIGTRRTLTQHAFFAYVVANGYLLRWFGFVLPWGRSYNSWQDIDSMLRMLGKRGCEAQARTSGPHSIVEGRKLRRP